MKIGELASRTGTSVRSLRYYEQQGLLASTRTPGGHRTYPDDAVDRVALVRCMIDAGVPTSAVVDLLPCVTSGTVTPSMLAGLERERERVAERARQALETLERLDVALAGARERLAPAG